jgi:hypothetical protein
VISSLKNCGFNAYLTCYGSDIGKVLKLDLNHKKYGYSQGFGFNYTDLGNLNFDTKTIEFWKPIRPFLDDRVSMDIQQSNGDHVYHLTKLGTFANAAIRDLCVNEVTANGYGVVGALCNHAPSYIGTTGLIDEDQKIYDGYYYQEYSYVIKIDKIISEWKDFIKKLCHPAGFIMFNEYEIQKREEIVDINTQMEITIT